MTEPPRIASPISIRQEGLHSGLMQLYRLGDFWRPTIHFGCMGNIKAFWPCRCYSLGCAAKLPYFLFPFLFLLWCPLVFLNFANFQQPCRYRPYRTCLCPALETCKRPWFSHYGLNILIILCVALDLWYILPLPLERGLRS